MADSPVRLAWREWCDATNAPPADYENAIPALFMAGYHKGERDGVSALNGACSIGDALQGLVEILQPCFRCTRGKHGDCSPVCACCLIRDPLSDITLAIDNLRDEIREGRDAKM